LVGKCRACEPCLRDITDFYHLLQQKVKTHIFKLENIDFPLGQRNDYVLRIFMIRWKIFIFLIRESHELQIHARDIKKILNVSDETIKSSHTHSEVEIVFQITMNFTTRCDIWVSERRGCEGSSR